MPPSNPPPRPRKWLRSRVASFGYAFGGIATLVRTQPHAQIHLLATVSVGAAAYGFGVSHLELALLVLAVGTVWTAEAANTSIEFLVDLVHPEWHEVAGKVKDLAAGAVLFAAAAAAGVGVLVFLPYVWRLLDA